MENIFQPDPLENNILQELGLTHEYPLHTDVLNNETGFALYIDSPYDKSFFNFYDGQGRPEPVHETEYDPAAPIVYSSFLVGASELYADLTYLRVRELDEEGNPGEWHRIPITWDKFKANNPPDVLEDLGFDRFDTVTWLEGLEEDKQYQVQLCLI